MIINKTVFKICEFIKAVLVTFLVIVFTFFVDKSRITITISSHLVTEVSATLFKYLLFSQIHLLGLKL